MRKNPSTLPLRLVLADDHKVVRDGLRWMLAEESGVEVVGEAAHGGELLDLLEERPVDVVLLDLRMPEVGGLEALAELRLRFPWVRVVVLTMHDEPGYLRRAIELGASGYLLKSADRGELLQALETVAAGEAYVQRELTGLILDEVAGRPGWGPVPSLSRREMEVLRLVAAGCDNKEIGRRLEIAQATVKSHLKAVFNQLGARGRAEAVAVALRLGIIE